MFARALTSYVAGMGCCQPTHPISMMAAFYVPASLIILVRILLCPVMHTHSTIERRLSATYLLSLSASSPDMRDSRLSLHIALI
jgi:hypothetical protein